jgi:hypothetical protein
MNTVVIGAATSSTSSPATIFGAPGGVARVRQCAVIAEATYAAGRHLRRAVSIRKEALERRLQDFVLELLAAIVLMAIFMIVTDPATREDC